MYSVTVQSIPPVHRTSWGGSCIITHPPLNHCGLCSTITLRLYTGLTRCISMNRYACIDHPGSSIRRVQIWTVSPCMNIREVQKEGGGLNRTVSSRSHQNSTFVSANTFFLDNLLFLNAKILNLQRNEWILLSDKCRTKKCLTLYFTWVNVLLASTKCCVCLRH